MALLLRFWPYIAAVAVILGGVWLIYDWGADNAEAKAAARQAKIERDLATMKRELEQTLTEGMAAIGRDVNGRLQTIDGVSRTEVQPVIVREIANAPRTRDPSAGLTPGMFDAIERARRLSAPAPAGPDDRGTLPGTPRGR